MDFKKIRQTAIENLEQRNTLAASSEPSEQRMAALIDKALLELPERDRLVLDIFHVNRKEGWVQRALTATGKDWSTVFRWRREALLHFQTALIFLMYEQ